MKRTCSDCVNCKVSTITRIQPSYFTKGGVCPPVVRKHLRINCAKELQTAVMFISNYQTIEAFENGDDNFAYADECEYYESDD